MFDDILQILDGLIGIVYDNSRFSRQRCYNDVRIVGSWTRGLTGYIYVITVGNRGEKKLQTLDIFFVLLVILCNVDITLRTLMVIFD